VPKKVATGADARLSRAAAQRLSQYLRFLATGGPTGSGPGWGDPGVIPAGNTDLVLPALGEEWGFAGVAAVFALALQLDGKIIVSGSFYYVNGHVRLGLARLNQDGTLDGTFKAFVDAPRSFSYVRQVTVQADGKILFAGYLTDGRLVVGRLNADGSLDPTFHSDNSLPPAPQDFVSALQPDGKVVGVGLTMLAGMGLVALSMVVMLEVTSTADPLVQDARRRIDALKKRG
jgi:uncharacterized delta-60 repeat protein